MNKSNKKPQGFSLIEVLIGLILLAFGILALGSLQVNSVRGNFSSNNLMQATYVGQDGLEFLNHLPFDHGLLATGNHDGNLNPIINITGMVFNRSYAVIDHATGYKIINYTVTWNDGIHHRITLSTIRSQ